MASHANDITAPAKVDPTEGHTPIPWTIGRHFPDAVYNADLSRGIAECCDERLPFDQVTVSNRRANLANAALICRAVNAHQALIDALEMFERATDTGDADDYIDAEREMKKALNLARGEA